MRKKVTGLIIIAIVAVVLFSTIIILLLHPAKDSDTDSDTGTVAVLTLSSTDISEIQVTNQSSGFSLVRKDESTFKLKDKDSLPQNATTISSIITELTSVTAVQSIAKEPTDLSVYGLSSPTATIKIILNSGEEKSLFIGNASLSGNIYLKTADSNEVFAISSSSISCYNYTNLDFYDLSITTTATTDTIDYFRLAKGNDVIYELSKLPEADSSDVSSDTSTSTYSSTFEMLAPFSGDSNSTNLSTALTALSSLAFTEAVSDDVSTANLKNYGLDSPKYTFTYNYSDLSSTVYFGNKDDDGNYYAMLKDRGIVYTVASSSASFLDFSSTDMFASLIFLRNITTVKNILMEGYDLSYSFDLENSASSNSDDLVIKYNGQTYDTEKFRTLYQTIIGVSIAGSGTKPSGNPVATITFTTNDGAKDVIKYYKYDDRNMFVTVNGSGNFYANKTQVEKIFSNCKSYLNGDDITA